MDEEPPIRRRLAAILAADIAGYSRLMHADEAATVRDLKAHQSVILPLIGRHGGRIIDTAGDGIMAEFPSVIGATECAVEIQTVMTARNREVPQGRRMLFRIGINLGDVIHDETRIYGDGINIAARLEALAEPGGVLVSNNVYDQIRGKLPLTFDDVGERQVKNIEQPVRMFRVHIPGVSTEAVARLQERSAMTTRSRWIAWGLAAFLILGGAALAWWMGWRLFQGPRADSPEAPRLSVVVLPFRNLSGNPSEDYFADGITEDLTSDLSRIAGSFVISRNTAFTFKDKAVDARQVGRELGVRYVLEGSVRRMEGAVRVNAELIDAGTGAHLWAEQVDVDRGALASLPDNFGIANRLARTLSVELVNVEGRRAQRADPDAVDLAMRGWSLLNGGPTNKDDVQRSVALFEDALRIDPANGQARVGLAQALTLIYRNRWDPEPAQVLARADEAATRAISAAPNYAPAHSVKAEVLGLANRFDAALATYDRAIALDRNHAVAYVGRARNLILVGRAAEALAPVEHAIRLSPRDPELYVWYFVRCHASTHLERDASTIEWCNKSIATGKTFFFAYVDLASAYAWRGQKAEAAAAVAELLKLRPGYTVQRLEQEGSEASDSPVFRREYKRIVEGARRAGLPER
jgi:TolB-like protein/class 3 adenylate cyclase